jgi:ubiquinone/menaquinone biosynthesis C-methylase UbiE
MLTLERRHWEENTEAYIFYDDKEYRLILSLFGRESFHGMRLLEIGCGAGVWTKTFARLGAQIYHFDLAEAIVKQAQQRAVPWRTHGFVADMHFLPFPNGYFDAVFGSMVMHHTQSPREFGEEVARVLKPSGRAVFHENSARNPFLMFARRWIVGRFGVPRNSSPGEHPLCIQEIQSFSRAYTTYKIYIGRMVLLQLAVKYLLHTERGFWFKMAHKADDLLFTIFPGMRWMSYYQILEFQAPAGHKEIDS